MFSFIFFIMNTTPIKNLSASKQSSLCHLLQNQPFHLVVNSTLVEKLWFWYNPSQGMITKTPAITC
jgi:hypothetical protein